MEELLAILEETKPGFEFKGRTDLVDSGDLDSFDVITVVAEINNEFDINFPVEKIVPEVFNSVEGIYAVIQKELED